LLLLLSTANADKAPKPASFLQRLAMMVLFAEDLQGVLAPRSGGTPDTDHVPDVSIDIGLTTCPYYTDKSIVIVNAIPIVYASQPPLVFLLGYDTLIRFLAPKYYAGRYDPPLSAVAPFFEPGHELQVLLRPDGNTEGAGSGGLEDQWAYLAGLRKGALTDAGFEPSWADQISVLEPSGDTDNVSSTKIRAAAKKGAWGEVAEMCSPGVMEWIKDQKLYVDDD
jgi:nicotinamide-nucleotide adenylyltransferase